MLVSQKCQYALKALYELARRGNDRPAKISDIAETQAIPTRFLEVILNQLKQGGFIESRRGSEGGYLILRPPQKLTVGEVMRFIHGSLGPIEGLEDEGEMREEAPGAVALNDMWRQARKAILNVYDKTTIQDLITNEEKRKKDYVPMYAI